MSTEAPICPYCGQRSKLVTGGHVYPHRPDLARLRFYECSPCDARAGPHGDGVTPLGRLADAQLRAAKMRAHAAFDPLWKNWREAYPHVGGGDVAKRCKSKARSRAYRWLSQVMGLPSEQTHIGMFDVAQCNRVVDVMLSADVPSPRQLRAMYRRDSESGSEQ